MAMLNEKCMKSPQIMGVLNVTPDSFSDGGKFTQKEAILAHAEHLFACGATIVDVGAESTRPGAVCLTDAEEWERLLFFLPDLLQQYPEKISLDTKNTATAQKFVDLGGKWVNSVNAAQDKALWKLVLERDLRVFVNHFPAQNVKEVHAQQIDSIFTVKDDLLSVYDAMRSFGIKKDQIILDPGIGFGKTMRLNKELLRFAELIPEISVLIGFSKKRFLGEERYEKNPNVEAFNVVKNSGTAWVRMHNPEWCV